MRLLLLTPEYAGGGGIRTFYRALAPALCAAGVELRVIEGSAFYSAEECAERTLEGVGVETLERARLDRWHERFPAFAATPGLRRHLAAAWAMWEQAGYGEGYDVIEASDWGLLFVPPAVEGTRPLVVQCHGSIGQLAVHDPIAGEEMQSVLVRLIERAAIATAQSVQTLSQTNAAFWRSEAGRDVAMIRPAWMLPAAPATQGPGTRGLVVGKVQALKGPEIVCGALQRLGTRAPAIDWIGCDTTYGARESSTAGHLLRTFPSVWGKRINHHSLFETPQEITRRQSNALFNLVPSTWEVFNMTAVESMASGRPTIISTGAGASELIADQVNGYLFASGDADGLAVALDRCLGETPARLAAIGEAARETVRTALDPKAIAAQRVAAYRTAIATLGSQPPSPATEWLRDICRPTKPLDGYEMAFLDHLPMRAIAAHLLARSCQKIMSRLALSQ